MKKVSKCIHIVALILLITSMGIFFAAVFGHTPPGEAYYGSFDTMPFNKNWVVYDGEKTERVTLPIALEDKETRVVTLKNTLPKYVTHGMRISFRTCLQDIQIYIDNELRGCYCTDELKNAPYFLPSSYVLVDLRDADAGKNIDVAVTVKSKAKINSVNIGYGNNIWFDIITRNVPVVSAAFVLSVLGIVSVILYLLFCRKYNAGKSVLYLGAAMIATGLWIISESEMRQLIFNIPSHSTWFLYIFIELVPGFVLMYFNEFQKHRYEKVYVIGEFLTVGQVAVNAILAFFGVKEFYLTLGYSHIWMVLAIIIGITTVLLDIKNNRIKEYMISAVGLLLFIFFCIIELLVFYIKHFYILGKYLCLGLIILLTATVIQLIYEEIEKIKKNLAMEKEQIRLERKVVEQSFEIIAQQEKRNELYLHTIVALSEAVDAKDRYTSGHSKRVAEYAGIIAQRMGKNREEQDEIYQAGLLHDIGKIRVPASIINKPNRLTDEEYDIIKVHPVTGYHILSGITQDSPISLAAKYHHERYDGKGYPNGLLGDGIPEVARIIGVADAYDAMTSNRSYRSAMKQSVLREEIEKGKGTQFDPHIADIMLQMIDEDKCYAMRQQDNRNRRILSINNDASNNKVIVETMRDNPDYEIVAVSSVSQAMDIIDNENFNLILFDFEMPETDGFEVLKQIRSKCCIPVVIITSKKGQNMSTELRQMGCEDYITKPISPLILREVIHNITEKTDIKSFE